MKLLILKFAPFWGFIFILSSSSLQAGWRDTLSPESFKLEIDVEASPTKQPIYREEYGVFIPIDDPTTQYQAKEIADRYGSTLLIPHISLLQGRFEGNQIEAVADALRKLAEETVPFIIKLKSEVVEDKSGNSFWEVDPASGSWGLLNEINKKLCALVPHPVGILKQVYDSNTSAEEDRLIEKYGRDFNVPESNNLHITVAYGVQSEEVNAIINKNLADKNWISKALRISYGRIDLVGNVYTIEESYPFTGLVAHLDES
ncbi:MAG: hypothetical protein K0R76_1459 [Alphaproteobacteria bacterium]|jgi:hypothetical protein|nr:hypothetical protein [Alphaproteobacteria bacterium]